jgi:hypothetical protein
MALLEAIVVAATIAALVFSYAAVSGSDPAGANSVFAAKNGNRPGGGGSTTATCVISPSRVQAWQDWTVTATGLPTGSIVGGKLVGASLHTQYSDGVGGTGWNFFTPDGTYSFTARSSAAGTTTVTFMDASTGKAKVLTSCTTSVY